MPTVTFKCNGTAGTSTLTTTYGVSPVGTGQILMDGNDATHLYYGGGGGAFESSVAIPGSREVPQSGFTIYLRLKTTLGSTDDFNCGLAQGGLGQLASWRYASHSRDLIVSEAGGWVRIELVKIALESTIADALNGFTAPVGGVEPLGTGGEYIYEAEFVVEWGGVMPPARLFPREDGLGVGGGRHFPPPKSRQRSARGFGYY